MKKLFLLSALFSFLFISCNDEPEPEPEPELIRAYCYLYHFVPGLENIKWIVNDIEVEENLGYSNFYTRAVVLESEAEEISFVVKHAGTGEVLESRTVTLEEDKYYTAIISGAELDPVLLIQEVETSRPQAGKVKFQFFHAGIFTDSIDVYMGGSTPEKRTLTDLEFKELSDHFEANDYDARAAITVTVHSEEYIQDNVLLTSLYNEMLVSQASYLTVLAPYSIDPESQLTLWLYDLYVEY